MDRLSDVLREAKFSWQGKSWKLPRPSLGSELAMASYLEDRALAAFERRRGTLHPEAYRQHLSVWQQDCAAGVYAYGNSTFDRSLRDPEVMQQWLWLILTQVKEQQSLQRTQMRSMWADCGDGMQLIEAYNLVMSPTPPMPPPEPAGDDSSSPPKSSPSSPESPSAAA